MFNTPILLIVFNRPDLTKIVFDRIRELKPSHLYIAADGPREFKEGEQEKCIQTRAVFDQIDWECEVKTLFQETNLGCRIGVSTAITWFFENVEAGIILEDDCLPDLTFFTYCADLLLHYKNDEHVMHIGGNNFRNRSSEGESYYFTKYSNIWGWASWKRAWSKYTLDMVGLPLFLESPEFEKYCPLWFERVYWKQKFIYAHTGGIDTWDYQWIFTIWKNGGKAIAPSVNMVSNLGFRPDATHTTDSKNVAAIQTGKISKIIHPKVQKINEFEDNYLLLKIDLFNLFETNKISNWAKWKEIIRVRLQKFIKN